MRTPRRFGRLLSLVALVSVLTVVGWTPMAHAATPRVEHGTFSFPVDLIDPFLCPFPLHTTGEVTGDFVAFFDDAGTITRLIIHFSDVLTSSANGVSVTSHERYNEVIVFDDSGNPVSDTSVGLIAHFRLPNGGTIGLDVGRIVEDPLTGDVLFQAGNFQLRSGDTAALCAAFS
jgi:hypothetical protein